MIVSADLRSVESLPSRLPFVQRVVVLATTSSTNDEARRLAEAGAPEGTVVIADAQSAGRGCFGRSWHSPPGLGIHLSVVLRPREAPARIPRWTLGAAVAACDACRSCGATGTAIAWPNDLVLGRRKMGGILVETRTQGEEVQDMVVGLGLNVHHAPPDFPLELRDLACSVRDASPGSHLDRSTLIARFLGSFDDVARALSMGDWERVARRWTSMSPSATGARVRVRSNNDDPGRLGTTRGVDVVGALRVHLDAGGQVLVRHGVAVDLLEE